jgi:hypothetical protein
LAWLFQLDSLNYWIMKGLKKTWTKEHLIK